MRGVRLEGDGTADGGPLIKWGNVKSVQRATEKMYRSYNQVPIRGLDTDVAVTGPNWCLCLCVCVSVRLCAGPATGVSAFCADLLVTTVIH